MTDAVLIDELATACGRRFGVATLDAPGSLHALTLDFQPRFAGPHPLADLEQGPA